MGPKNRADAVIASQATGAMSHAFISAIKANPKQSYVQLLNSVRDILEKEYSQKPQLSCSHPLGMLFSFFLFLLPSSHSRSSRSLRDGAARHPASVPIGCEEARHGPSSASS